MRRAAARGRAALIQRGVDRGEWQSLAGKKLRGDSAPKLLAGTGADSASTCSWWSTPDKGAVRRGP